ncbi:MAG: hypothetical protein ACXVIJ_11520, partial [Thermoanaerobaculia bacterium]
VDQQQTGTAYFDAIRLQETPVANSSFERGLVGWTSSGFVSGDGAALGGADGNRGLKVGGVSGSKSIGQSLALSGASGERFDLSVWTRTVGTDPSGGPIRASLTFFNTDGTTSVGSLDLAKAAHDWVNATTEIRAPKPFARARAALTTSGQTGTVWFDDVRVARTWTHNSSFENGTTGWSGYAAGAGTGSTQATAREGASALLLTGKSRTGFVQSIPFGGRAGHRFVLSGWVRTSSTSPTGGLIGYIAAIRNTDGTTTAIQLPAEKGTHPWRYGERLLVATKAFSRVDVYAVFYDQSGTAYFDGVRLRNA